MVNTTKLIHDLTEQLMCYINLDLNPSDYEIYEPSFVEFTFDCSGYDGSEYEVVLESLCEYFILISETQGLVNMLNFDIRELEQNTLWVALAFVPEDNQTVIYDA